MKTLVLFFHGAIGPGSKLEAKYLDALRAEDLNPDNVHLEVINKGVGSAVYERYIAGLKGEGTVLERVLRELRLGPPRRWRRIVIVTFSAGYGAARAIYRDRASRKQVHVYVALDSIHSGFDSDGTARDYQLEMFVPLALRAVDGEAVFYLSHSDTPTPQPPARGAFSSTTQNAEEICRLVGVEMPPVPAVGQHHRADYGGFTVESFNMDAAAWSQAEHGRALTGWGPRVVAEAVRRGLELDVGETVAGMPAVELDEGDIKMPWGLRALTRAITALGAKVSETLRPMVVRAFHAMVGGAGWLTEQDAWCASFASACAMETRFEGDVWPHKPTFRVREIWSSAIARATAVGMSKLRKDPALRKEALVPGNLLCMARGSLPQGEGANAIGYGHVARIERFDEATGELHTVDGNVSDEVARRVYGLWDERLVGVVLYPGGDTLDNYEPTMAEIERLTHLESLRFDELRESA